MRSIVLSLLFLAGCMSTASPPPEVGSTTTVTGTVESADLEPMMVDGDAVLTVHSTSGERIEVFIAARMGLCKAEGLDGLGEIEPGDRIEARGRVMEGGGVRPCDEDGHYLRRLGGAP